MADDVPPVFVTTSPYGWMRVMACFPGQKSAGPTGGPPVVPLTIWANEGGDKVTQDELRASNGGQASVVNSSWDGTNIKQFGAKNEVVSLNLIIESPVSSAPNVSVTMSQLVGPGGSILRSDPARGVGGVFSWLTSEIELFYVRYLPINSLSAFAFGTLTGTGFEPQVPNKLRLPLVGGVYTGTWTSRPNAGKYYPDIMVPMEAQPTFTIPQANNQQVWADIYIPKTAAAGLYTGTVTVSENSLPVQTIPVQLTVLNFALPDTPSFKVMMDSGYGDVTQRYTGVTFPAVGSAGDLLGMQVLANQRYVAHRHKLCMIGDDAGFSNANPQYPANPSPAYQPFVTGAAFVAANGYAGPGVNTPQGVYSIGTYGSWKNDPLWPQTQAGFQARTNAWETWFENNSPTTIRFVYLADESTNYPLVNQWANWMGTNPGIGVNLASFATIGLVDNVQAWNAGTAYAVGAVAYLSGVIYEAAVANTNSQPPNANWTTYANNPSGPYTSVSLLEPDLDYVCSSTSGATAAWNAAAASVLATQFNQVFRYNGARPFFPTMHTEEPGTDPRAIAWNCYKKGVPLWFYWEVTYYNDNQAGFSGHATLNLNSNVLTITSVGGGQLNPGWVVAGASIPVGTTIVAQLSGTTGGVGTYQMSALATATVTTPESVTSTQGNLFADARTFSASPNPQATKGTVYGDNGEGMLFFPGTDAIYPSASYGLPGPIASARLKHLRRGVQDADYLALANAVNPAAVTSLVASMVPLAIWETPVHDTNDPTYYINQPASWSEDPNVWESARQQLAAIIAPVFPRLGAYLIGGSVQTSLGQNAFQQQIATLGVAVVGTYPGWSSGGFTMNTAAAAVKAINPGIKLFVYTNIMELEPGVGLSGSPYSPIYDVAAANRWFLYTAYNVNNSSTSNITDADGNAQSGLNQTTFTNAGSGFANYLAWRANWSAANEVGGTNWDGLFLDNVFFQPRVTADYNQSGVGQTASAAATNWRNGYVSYVPQLQAAITVGGNLVGANTADWGNGAITGYNQLFNGGVIESIMGQSYSPENSSWLNMMNNYYKVIMNAMTPGGYMIFEQDISATSYAGIRYGICSCLLDNGYYFNNANGPGGGSTIHPTDETNFKLGGATASPNNPTNGTWSSGGIAVYQHGVYRRDFVNGVVLLNPRGNGPQNITLEKDAYYLRAVIDTDGINTAVHVPAGTNIPLPDAATANIGGGGLIMSWTPT